MHKQSRLGFFFFFYLTEFFHIAMWHSTKLKGTISNYIWLKQNQVLLPQKSLFPSIFTISTYITRHSVIQNQNWIIEIFFFHLHFNLPFLFCSKLSFPKSFISSPSLQSQAKVTLSLAWFITRTKLILIHPLSLS